MITASDGVSRGVREDTSGAGRGERLEALARRPAGDPARRARRADRCPPPIRRIARPDRDHRRHRADAATTPQATRDAIDYEVLVWPRRCAAGRRSTPLADLSRALSPASIGRTLVVNLPGSSKGAMQSLSAIEPVLDYALETLAGPFEHGSASSGNGDR